MGQVVFSPLPSFVEPEGSWCHTFECLDVSVISTDPGVALFALIQGILSVFFLIFIFIFSSLARDLVLKTSYLHLGSREASGSEVQNLLKAA